MERPTLTLYFLRSFKRSSYIFRQPFFKQARHGWTGLLVEPYVNELTFKKRKSFLARTCLGTQRRPHYAQLDMAGSVKGAMGGLVKEKTETSLRFQCIPLYTLLLAIGNPTVNWFILDIEGAEYQVNK